MTDSFKARFAKLAVGSLASLLRRPALRPVRNALFYSSMQARGFDISADASVNGELRFIRTELAAINPGLCIDVGANRGDFARLLLDNTDARVISFEPLSAPFAELERLGQDHAERLTAVQSAVGNEVGTTAISFNPDRTEHAAIHESARNVSYIDNTETVEIAVTTLDTALLAERGLERVDFIKIDTEGFEKEVLEGATEVIGRLRPKLVQIEFNWHHLFRSHSLWALSQLLPDYEVFRMFPDRLEPVDPAAPEANIFMYSNYVFSAR